MRSNESARYGKRARACSCTWGMTKQSSTSEFCYNTQPEKWEESCFSRCTHRMVHYEVILLHPALIKHSKPSIFLWELERRQEFCFEMHDRHDADVIDNIFHKKGRGIKKNSRTDLSPAVQWAYGYLSASRIPQSSEHPSWHFPVRKNGIDLSTSCYRFPMKCRWLK